jgi:transcriptional regulator GlxA family with amidase domain
MGLTAHHYLTLVRVKKAKQLLRQGEPVASVCLLVGFESSTTFSGLFKRMAGTQPSSAGKVNSTPGMIGFPHWMISKSKKQH